MSAPAHRPIFLSSVATDGPGALSSFSPRHPAPEGALLDALAFPVAVLDRDGIIVSVNRAWCDGMAGTAAERSFPGVGADFLRLYEDNGSPEGTIVAAGVQAVCRGRRASFDLDFQVSGAEDPVWFRLSARPLGAPGPGAVVTTVDVTAYMSVVDLLVERGMRDPLTGLANRALLVDHLQLALDRASRRDGRVALAFVDLDNFKRVNDAYGHAAGDHLLRAVATRLRGAVRDEDTVARIGGDEFVVLFSDVAELDTALALAQRLCDCLAEPIALAGNLHQVSASIGCTVATVGATALSLVSEADEAMYRAKGAGKGRIELFGDHFGKT